MGVPMAKSFALLPIIAISIVVGIAHAQQRNTSAYPDHAVRIVVPFPAGGTADILPRIVADKLRQRWNQSIVVENHAGAGGNVGASVVAAADPDGYTLLASPPGPIAINQMLYKSMSYDSSSLEPIVILATVPNVLVVRSEFSAKTMQDLIAYGKANPGKITYASQGNGSTAHLTAELFQSMAGIEMTHVPYKGSAPAEVDLMAGVVDIMFDNLASALPAYNGKKVRILAVGSQQRAALVPDIPTIRELGLSDFQSVTWFAVVAPAKTPPAISNGINKATNAVLQMPDVKEKFLQQGAQPYGGTIADMAQFVADERERWGDVIKAAHISIVE
jgi:tripartite-type tricarboxylate transporter receptor subunit TctC